MKANAICGSAAATLLLFCAPAAFAQDRQEPEETKEPRRTRLGLGVQVVPSYPGSDSVSVRPLFEFSRERGNEPFEFEAPDESFGFPIWEQNGWAVGPALGFEGSRKGKDVGTVLPKVGFTVEVGGFVQYQISPNLRARVEARQGLGGHEGLIATVGADYVARDGDDWLFSIGPRLTFADDNYQGAYFSVAPQDSAAAGLPAYSADGGVQSAGVAAGYLRELGGGWGLYSYAKYDRLLGDAADSPIVRRFGSRDQLSGGLALTYTFGGE